MFDELKKRLLTPDEDFETFEYPDLSKEYMAPDEGPLACDEGDKESRVG